MDGEALVARTTIRSTWRSLVVLGVLAGLTAGFTIAAVAGARRSASSWERLRDETLASDAIAFASQIGIYQPDWSKVAELPYVEAAGAFGITLNAESDGLGAFVAVDGPLFTEVDRPRIVEGRAADPDAVDEAVISRPAPDAESPYRVGDTVTLHLYSAQQLMENDFASPPAGPATPLRIVGMADSPFERTAIPAAGSLMVGKPYWDRYGAETASFSNLMVRLENGQADVPRFTRDVTRLLGAPNLPVEDLAENSKRVTNGIDLETTGLLLFAAAMAAAGAVLLGQALIRSVRSGAGDVTALRHLGMTRSEVTRSLARPYVVTAAVAGVVAVVTAVVTSWWLPIGLARELDPDLGIQVDWPVLLAGVVLVVAAVMGAAWWSAWSASRPGAGGSAQRHPAWAPQAAARTGLPVTPLIGTGMALDPGSGRRAVPVRAALVACAVGVLGVVGALTLRAGIDDAVANPERFGVVWDALVFPPPDGGDGSVDAAVSRVVEDERVTAIAAMRREQLEMDGRPVPTYSLVDVRGSTALTALSGRLPQRPGEVALGPATASARGIEVGDTVAMGPDDDPTQVVGTVLLPQTPHSSFDQGALVPQPDLERMIGRTPTAPGVEPPPTTVAYMVSLADPSQLDDVVAPIVELAGGDPATVERASMPADAQNLRNVRTLPLLFAAFTVFLAIGALGHATASTIRRRRGEIAVLRALGLTPRQARGSFAWQGSTLAAAGLFVGIPLGVLAGVAAWRWVAGATPLVYVSPVLWWVLALSIPATLLVANLVALLPGRRAARIHLSNTLRAE